MDWSDVETAEHWSTAKRTRSAGAVGVADCAAVAEPCWSLEDAVDDPNCNFWLGYL